MTCSLVVSTYNRPDALELCLESILRQTQLPDEVVVADDGSGEVTHALVQSFQQKASVPVRHVWQPDEGYQLARIRNRAFAAASGEYIIQIDGDLLLDENFVSDHLKMSKPGRFVSGTRTMMDAELTQKLLTKEISAKDILKFPEHLVKRHNAVRSGPLREISYLLERNRRNYKYVLGCNMAFWKKDLLSVNGYNESFKGWGKEDNELTVRLQNAGVQLRFIKFGAVVYHLYHTVADLSSVPANEEKLLQTIEQRITFVPRGMNTYLSS
ncbi:MAG: glycosyltransferase family 2 protein [Chitinophagaceae bacterium]